MGTRVTAIAFPLLVLAVTHAPAKAGVVGFAQTLPFLLLYLPRARSSTGGTESGR